MEKRHRKGNTFSKVCIIKQVTLVGKIGVKWKNLRASIEYHPQSSLIQGLRDLARYTYMDF